MRLGAKCIKNLFLLASWLLICANLYSQQKDLHLERIGLVGEFSYYKQSAETHAIRIFNHKGIPDSVKSLMVTKYNILRGGYEQLLMQLISDMHVKKRMHYFKCLDKYFRTGKKKKRGRVADFIANWERVRSAYDDMINFPTRLYLDSMSNAYDKLKNEDLNMPDKEQVYQQDAPIKLDVTDPIGSIGSIFKIYRKLSLGDAQKTSNITEVLNTLRMRHASELIAKEEEEPEENAPSGNEAKLTKPLKKKP